ncbi:NAD-dependent epimerase/dehydratase family protein [Stappia sp. F7233]|uniref:NAD-dependent epimerase/dehydratase family protein n=1 Tax=Stappia albiluteola TaxID=2758565 RepID=A0A839AEJ4_9HYPH|nr:vitamin K epoxide reductase family protein [Stappia albiluteola]MBA5777546.1 NAD-dependent epimerase/dehydratase family protein [Stappia albiluteola]
METKTQKPLVVVTGASGSIGRSLCEALSPDYRVVGLDLTSQGTPFPCHEFDLANRDSVEFALRRIADDFGDTIASCIHLAAYFDFTGEDNPLYEKVNVEGTRNLLRALQEFDVGQFVYSSTMLVHAPGKPGNVIAEDDPIDPQWAYPASKAATEEVIRKERGDIPTIVLRLAGLYDAETSVPTLSHQIARIYERKFKSHLFAGDPLAGQAMIHRDDLVAAFKAAVDRRQRLPEYTAVLAGEPFVMGFGELQDRLGELIHGEKEWRTFRLPEALAKAGAWIEEKSEPVVPDDFDYSEKPFIRPFMIDMASDHYALDISRAGKLLGWSPAHSLREELPAMVENLKSDPYKWYRRNGITPPHWLSIAEETVDDPDRMRELYLRNYQRGHLNAIWAHWFNLAMAAWLITSPPLLGYQSGWMVLSDVVSGLLLALFAFASLSVRFAWARWACAAIGCWVMTAPLVFWAPVATAYLNGTLVGALIVGFAVLVPPYPGIAAVAERTGPVIPPGWDFSPSSWFQRLPVIILALVGLFVSRYLAAYQLGYIDDVWDPFFPGTAPGENGTEQIITSAVSRAWPVPDAGIGALTYMLEVLVGVVGSAHRWRSMPWLVMLFGLMIVPLGAISIFFIVIQPVIIGTYCTLCLIAAAAMLAQIPYSLDEMVACGVFLARRRAAGKPALKIFFTGDTDVTKRVERDDFSRPPAEIVHEMLTAGVSVPWNIAVSLLIGIGLMLMPLAPITTDLANAVHIAGALVISISVTAMAEVARVVRFLNLAVGGLLVLVPFAIDTNVSGLLVTIGAGISLMALSVRRGPVRYRYGSWDRYII